MGSFFLIRFALIIFALIFFTSFLPIKIGASIFGAQRRSFGICLLALSVGWLCISLMALVESFFIHLLALPDGWWGASLMSFLMLFPLALVYMLILKVGYIKSLAIAAIQILLFASLGYFFSDIFSHGIH